MHPDTLTGFCTKFQKKYNKLITKANKQNNTNVSLLPHINSHAFRHSQASTLLFTGTDIVTISKRLGHAKVSTTTDIYSHIMQKADETASNKLDEIFNTTKNLAKYN